MSIENKINQILAESRQKELQEGPGDVAQKAVNVVKKVAGVATGTVGAATGALQGAVTGARKNYAAINDDVEVEGELVEEETLEEANGEAGQSITTDTVTKVAGDNPDNARNAVVDQKAAEGGTSKKENEATKGAAAAEGRGSMKEDIDALVNGEDLSEEFKEKAATIFEAAVMTRVKSEIARIEEEYNTKLQEATEKVKEGLVEQVDGYLDYVVEQWIAQNEIALEHGIKTEIVESFIGGMKTLFEEHYIDVPEEKYDLVAEMEQSIASLEAKLDEQVAANVEMKKSISEMQRIEIIGQASEGLTDTEVEKFAGLAEELSFEDAESFTKKVQTIRENYFNTKAQSADVKSVVTDTPVDSLNETTKAVDPSMKAYLSVLNRK